MFSRIREAARVIRYQPPETGADAVIVEQTPQTSTQAGRAISKIVEAVLAVYFIALIAGRTGDFLLRFLPHGPHAVSTPTFAAAVGAFLMLIVTMLRADIEQKLRSQINVADALAPYFGRRLDRALRVFRTATRVT
jgi:TRAP-type C4-dicarboxylate transport system permease small subunit